MRTGLRLAAFVCALALLTSGCALLNFGSKGEPVTVYFSDGRDYTFSGENADAVTSLLRSLKYNSEEETEGLEYFDTVDAKGCRVSVHDGCVYSEGSGIAWMTVQQTRQMVTILDWAYARLPKPSTTATTTEAVVSTPDMTTPDSMRITDVPVLYQRKEFPSGCESVAAVMALRYAGVDITVAEFVDKHLKTSYDFSYKNGQKYGPSPYEYFLGNPRTTNAYGCMAPVIEDAMASVLGGNERVHNASGMTMKELCAEYIAKGIPVVIWATIEMREPTFTDSWILPDGTEYTSRTTSIVWCSSATIGIIITSTTPIPVSLAVACARAQSCATPNSVSRRSWLCPNLPNKRIS